jgi:hypothetical protein
MASLAKRGFLKQDAGSKTYKYKAAMNDKELTKTIIKTVAEKLLV